MNRLDICNAVGRLITEDRNRTHGQPSHQFSVAQMLKRSVALGARSKDLQPTEQEAVDMICTKLARLACGSSDPDHWRDIIGYAAIAWEAVESTAEPAKADMYNTMREYGEAVEAERKKAEAKIKPRSRK